MTRILYFSCLLLLFSCSKLSYNQVYSDINVNITADLNASITVGDNISGVGNETLVLFFFRWPGTRYRTEGGATTLNSNFPATMSIPVYSTLLSWMNPFNIIEHAKGQAIHNAITTSNADILINPKFTITEQDFFFYKTVKCEVSGKKGTIKSIK